MLGDGADVDLDGVDPVMAEQIRADLAARRIDVDVWPENHDAVALFMRCQTQWRRGLRGNLVGFDYTGVDVVMRHMPLTDPSDTFGRLQIMERAALAAMNE